MATDYWASSQYKRWVVDRATLRQARSDDLMYVEDPELLDFLNIYFANLISKLGKRLSLRQRVIATATIFFRRFYIKNSYCETDPFIVISACCYVAAKAEESPVHIKNVVSESRQLFSQEGYGIKHFPSDNSKLAEMEFYLVDDLECDLTIFHPYRTLMALCGKENGASSAEAGELGIGIDDGPRYWGTGEGKLELQEGPLQMAWFIINDTYRSDICLLYPPHLIAIAAIYLTLVLNPTTRATLPLPSRSPSQSQSQSPMKPDPAQPSRRSSRNSSGSTSSQKKSQPDAIGFMAGLNVSMSLIATIAQEIIALYTLWERYKDDAIAESGRTGAGFGSGSTSARGGSMASAGTKRSGSRLGSGDGSIEGTPLFTGREGTEGGTSIVTPTILTRLLFKMREAKMADLAHPASGRPVAVNKMLERTQAAG